MYEVYETDADDSMEGDNLRHRGISFDVAESRMIKLYELSGCQKDFLLFDVNRQEIKCEALSLATAAKKGICFE